MTYEDFKLEELGNSTGGGLRAATHQHWAERGVSTAAPQPPQMRFQDMAYGAYDDVLGISYYDPVHGNVKLSELDMASGDWSCQIVDNGAFGDTSLVYDSSGNPNVAYFGIDLDNDDLPDNPGVTQGVIQEDETPKVTSAIDVSGGSVYWRRRVSGTWQTAEIVNNGKLFSQGEHNIHVDNLNRPYLIMSAGPTTASGTKSLGIPAHIKRTGTNTWVKNDIPVSNGMTNMQLDSVSVNGGIYTTCYAVIWDQLAGDLILAVGSDSSWTLTTIVEDIVKGYQSIAKLSATTFGISYMASPDNKLKYGVWNTGTSTYTELHESEFADTGYQSEVAVDSSGRPFIVSISKADGLAMLTWYDGSDFHEKLLGSTYCGQVGGVDYLSSNTIRSILVDGENPVVSFLPHGGISFCTIDFAP